MAATARGERHHGTGASVAGSGVWRRGDVDGAEGNRVGAAGQGGRRRQPRTTADRCRRFGTRGDAGTSAAGSAGATGGQTIGLAGAIAASTACAAAVSENAGRPACPVARPGRWRQQRSRAQVGHAAGRGCRRRPQAGPSRGSGPACREAPGAATRRRGGGSSKTGISRSRPRHGQIRAPSGCAMSETSAASSCSRARRASNSDAKLRCVSCRARSSQVRRPSDSGASTTDRRALTGDCRPGPRAVLGTRRHEDGGRRPATAWSRRPGRRRRAATRPGRRCRSAAPRPAATATGGRRSQPSVSMADPST